MALPMIFIVSVYNDFKYMLMVNTGVVIESFISVFIGASTGKFGYLGLDAAAIQIVTVLITGGTRMSARTYNKSKCTAEN